MGIGLEGGHEAVKGLLNEIVLIRLGRSSDTWLSEVSYRVHERGGN